MVLNFAPKSVQSARLLVPAPLSSSKKRASFLSSSLFTTHGGSNPSLIYRNRPKNYWCFGLCSPRGNSLRRSCSVDDFNEFSEDELLKQIQGLAEKFDDIDYDDDDNQNDKDTAHSVTEVSCDPSYVQPETNDLNKGQFMPSKFDLLEHNLLGIQPEPGEWPERDEVARVNIEQKANCVGIPLSLRMIRRKRKWREGLGDAGDFAYCSVKKAFSSLVFIIRELQSYALHIRENLYSEDLKEIISKVQREMSSSFVWLFQQVFSRTPTLMVYVMILLANFTVQSMMDQAVVAASPPPTCSYETITETVSLTEEKNQIQSEIDASTTEKLSVSNSDVGNRGGGKKVAPVATGSEDWYRHQSRSWLLNEHPSVLPNEKSNINYEMTKEEAELWNSMLEEASRMKEESRHRIIDREIMQLFVTPITVQVEPDDYVDYFRTDLLYQMGIAKEPDNSLLLSNYAQLLHLVARDYDRAEECYKRAVQVEPPDAEALSKYADFLWRVRKDLWGAEERYQQAMAAEPSNPSYASKYATFLWSTGGEDTCFPLSNANDNCNKGL